MDYNNNTKLVIDALLMAIKNKPKQQKVLPHSDQGLTYRACEYTHYFSVSIIFFGIWNKPQLGTCSKP
jgi:uncharacterized membrane protein YiaA